MSEVSKPTKTPQTWAIIGKDGREYAASLGEPITAPAPGWYSIRYPLIDPEGTSLVMVLLKDER